MRVWLLHVGEELPVDGTVRRYRYGYLAEALEDAGHEVLRWAPTFRHLAKVQRFSSDTRVAVSARYQIQFVHSPGYRRNIGIQRLRTYRVLERRLRELAAGENPPDLIIAAIPTLEWANAAIDIARTHHVPAIIDVRDTWPDVYLNALPSPARPASRLLLARHFRLAKRVCRNAAALTAVSTKYLEWALTRAERDARASDTVVPLGYEPNPISAEKLQSAVASLRKRGIDPARPTVFFAGRLERSYDLKTVVQAARQLEAAGEHDVQFVVCGDGAGMRSLVRQAHGLRNFHLLGWVDPATVHAVASISMIGLCTYARDATQSVPNKPFEYMASRVAVVSSLQGEMADMLRRYHCGLTYCPGNADSLTSTLKLLLDRPELCEQMRSNAVGAWARNYRAHDIYARFVNCLEQLAAPCAQAA
jgi:glycosyltransferase involved in cell wall biosynthesis